MYLVKMPVAHGLRDEASHCHSERSEASLLLDNDARIDPDSSVTMLLQNDRVML